MKDKIYNRFDIRISRLVERYIVSYRDRCYRYQNKKNDEKWTSLFVKTPYIKFDLGSNTFINLYEDSILSKIIYNGFEENEITFLKKILCKGDTFIDIGANVGLFSLIASNIVGSLGKIYAFEPTPETFRRFCENITLNSMSNIVPIQEGLSDKEGELSFHISQNGYDAWNSFAKLNLLKDSETISVKTTTLDYFIDKNELEISSIKLIKIDVEGWELNVLRGAEKLLSREDAPALMVEFTEENAFVAGVYCGEIFDYVKQFGYEWYRYDSVENRLIPEEKRLHYPYDNLFAIKDIEQISKLMVKQ